MRVGRQGTYRSRAWLPTIKPRRFTIAEEIKPHGRSFLGTAAATIAAAQLGMFRSADAQSYKKKAAVKAEIRPFRINVPIDSLIDRRRRLEATRWLDRETVTDQSQGVQPATMRDRN